MFNIKAGVKKFTAPVVKGAYKVGLKVKDKSPEICLVLGIGTGIAAAVTACKATKKSDDILDRYYASKDAIEEAKKAATEMHEVYSVKDEKRDKAIAMRDLVIDEIKLYGPSVALGAVSIGLILASYGILRKRNLGLIATYTALDETFKRYRKGVVEKFGEDVDQEIMYGKKKVKGLVTDIDKDGNEVTEEREVYTAEDAMLEDVSNYGRIFSEHTSTSYVKGDPYYNEAFLKSQEAFFNDILHSRGYVFLSDVYKALGFPETTASRYVGWIEDSAVGDNYISFGIREPMFRETGEMISPTGKIQKTLSGKEWLLDFNVDGVIMGLFDKRAA